MMILELKIKIYFLLFRMLMIVLKLLLIRKQMSIWFGKRLIMIYILKNLKTYWWITIKYNKVIYKDIKNYRHIINFMEKTIKYKNLKPLKKLINFYKSFVKKKK